MKNLVPYFILKQYEAKRHKGCFYAYTLNLDISGFTKLTEMLMKHGKSGSETLTEALNEIFEPIIEQIYINGGFITSFAGDGFNAILPVEARKPDKITALRLMHILSFIKAHFQTKKNIRTPYGNFRMDFKAFATFGRVGWMIIKAVSRYSYLFNGKPIEKCSEFRMNIRKGDIIADKSIIGSIEGKKRKIRNKELYRLKTDKFHAAGPSPCNNNETDRLLYRHMAKFLPSSVLNFRGIAEFRDIVSVFILFSHRIPENNMKKLIRMLIDSSDEFGGYLNKADIGDKGGTALVLFGAPVSYENNIERALSFILSIKSRVTAPALRTGISFGPVYSGIIGSHIRCEYTAIGDIVNLSARLAGRAKKCESWCSPEVYRHMQRSFSFNFLDRLKFRGKSGKIPVYMLKGKKKIDELPVFSGKIAGRAREIKMTVDILSKSLRSGESHIAYISGDPGIGKSRLVAEVKKEIYKGFKGRISWFIFTCEEILRKPFNCALHFLKKRFGAFDEVSAAEAVESFRFRYNKLIRDITGINDEISDELKRTESIIAGYIGIGFEQSLYEKLDARQRYENFIYALKNLIKAESLINPVVIEIEDTQWMDADSLNFFSVLTTNLSGFPVSIISHARYRDDGTEFRLDADEIPETSIRLGALGKDSIQAISFNTLQNTLPVSDDLAGFIYSKSGGNPFFTEQILLDMNERNVLAVSQGCLDIKSTGLTSVPSNIRSIIISRLDRLSGEIKEFIQTASVLGKEFFINILENMMGRSDALLIAENIENENIWTIMNSIRCIFRHALLRDCAYEMQLENRLKEIHLLAAESYQKVFSEFRDEYYGDMAYHYEKAGNNEKAAVYYELAGNRASEANNTAQAYNYLEKALYYMRLTGTDKSRQDKILLEILNIEKLTGNWAKALEGFLKLAGTSAKNHYYDINAVSNLRTGQIYNDMGEYEKSEKYLKKALKTSEANNMDHLMGLSLGNLGILYKNMGMYDKSMECYEKKIKIMKKLRSFNNVHSTRANMGVVHEIRGDITGALELYKKSYAYFRRKKEISILPNILVLLGHALLSTGNIDLAEKYLKEQLRISRKIGDKRLIASAIGSIGIVYSKKFDLKREMECYTESYKIFRELGDKKNTVISLVNMGEIYCDMMELDKSLAYYSKALKITDRHSYRRLGSKVITSIGHVYCKKGENEKGIEYFKQSMKTARDLGLKLDLVETLYNISKNYYLIKNLSQAENYIKKCLNEAQKLDNNEYVLDSCILKEKINFQKSPDAGNRMEAVSRLENLVRKLQGKDKIAMGLYDLILMKKTMNISFKKEKKKALAVLKELHCLTGNREYRHYIDLVENL